MFISQEKKLIFFHIPKTAGSTVTNILNRVPMDNRLKNALSFNLLKIVKEEQKEIDKIYESKTWPPQHINQTKIRQALEISEVNVKKFFEFVIVRNPYDRLISLHNFSNYYTPKTTTFDELLDICEENINIDSYFNFWFKGQMIWINDPLTEKLHIFKYEELDKLWDTLREKLKLELSDIPHINVTKNKYISELSQIQKDRIYSLFKDEFETLGYDR